MGRKQKENINQQEHNTQSICKYKNNLYVKNFRNKISSSFSCYYKEILFFSGLFSDVVQIKKSLHCSAYQLSLYKIPSLPERPWQFNPLLCFSVIFIKTICLLCEAIHTSPENNKVYTVLLDKISSAKGCCKMNGIIN